MFEAHVSGLPWTKTACMLLETTGHKKKRSKRIVAAFVSALAAMGPVIILSHNPVTIY